MANDVLPAWFNRERLEEIKALGDLPSPKGAALAVMRLTNREGVSITELARVVQADPALVGRLIKAANSVQTGGHRPVVAVKDALVLLGTRVVRFWALGFSLLSDYHSGKCKSFNYPRFWSHSLACAVAMQALSDTTHAVPGEEAFCVGLLSRIGELSLATVFPQEYEHVLDAFTADPAAGLEVLEHAALSMTHSELAAAMLQDWGIPGMFVEAVFHHEKPEAVPYAPDSRQYRVVWSLALARGIADVCLAQETERRHRMHALLELADRLTLDGSTLVPLCERIVQEWQAWALQLDIQANDVPSFDGLIAPADDSGTGRREMHLPLENGEEVLRVLVAEDDDTMRLLIRTLLVQSGYEVFEARNGREAFEAALEIRPQILITDWLMPEMDGVELTRTMRQTKWGRSVYILILTVLEAEEKLIEAFDAGVDDFLSKPPRARVLGARLRAGQRVVNLQQELERDREKIRRFAAELAVTNRRLQEAALTDVLTGLPNRRYAIERLQQEWQAGSRSKRSMACMVIDVDQFKVINDTYGHDVGDQVLKETALSIKRGLRVQDVVCRTGGDEFLVICPETDTAAAMVCAERVRKSVAEMSVRTGWGELKGSVSIGVAARSDATADIDRLTKRADEGVYLAKQRGRNCVVSVDVSN